VETSDKPAPRLSVNKEHERVAKEFSQEFEILTVITNELKLATLLELQSVYDTQDIYDLLEIIDVHSTILSEQHKSANSGK
jgi:hypothetical protein